MVTQKLKIENFEDVKRSIKQDSVNSFDLLEQVWLQIFKVDLAGSDIPEGGIKPWHYRMSNDLSAELIGYSIEAFKEDRGGVALLWLNYSPSGSSALKEDEIEIDVEEEC